jgi:Cu/Ag efflux protein CusF
MVFRADEAMIANMSVGQDIMFIADRVNGKLTVIKMAQADLKYSDGKIKKIDAKAGKVTIIHGPLINLDMSAMTMVFRADEAMIANMSVGQDIMFIADRVNGKLTVIKMK